MPSVCRRRCSLSVRMSDAILCVCLSFASPASALRFDHMRRGPEKNHESPGTGKLAKMPSKARWISQRAWFIEKCTNGRSSFGRPSAS